MFIYIYKTSPLASEVCNIILVWPLRKVYSTLCLILASSTTYAAVWVRMTCRGLGLKPFLSYLMTGTLYYRDTEHSKVSCVWCRAVFPLGVCWHFITLMCSLRIIWRTLTFMSCSPVDIQCCEKCSSKTSSIVGMYRTLNWFWCRQKAERHSVDNSPFCPWRWSWWQVSVEADGTRHQKIISTTKREKKPTVHMFDNCV